MIPYPRDRITRKRDGRPRSKDELQPAGHFKPAVREISVQIESRANARPVINGEHDRQISPLEARQERHDSENLQAHENYEEKKIEFVVFKHEARWDAARVPQRRNRPRTFASNGAHHKFLFLGIHAPWTQGTFAPPAQNYAGRMSAFVRDGSRTIMGALALLTLPP